MNLLLRDLTYELCTCISIQDGGENHSISIFAEIQMYLSSTIKQSFAQLTDRRAGQRLLAY